MSEVFWNRRLRPLFRDVPLHALKKNLREQVFGDHNYQYRDKLALRHPRRIKDFIEKNGNLKKRIYPSKGRKVTGRREGLVETRRDEERV